MKLWPSWYNPPISRAVYIHRAAKVLGVSLEQIRFNSSKRLYSRRRFAIAQVMREHLDLSYKQIGNILTISDHSSAFYAVRRSKALVKICPDHAAMVDALEMVV